MQQQRIWEFIHTAISLNVPVMLMAVAESHGASPGKAGFKMVVTADGKRLGSIGGGIMERNWVEWSLEQLSRATPQTIARRLFHTAETTHERSGLICSGSQTIVLSPFDAGDSLLIESILRTLNETLKGRLSISPTGKSFEPGRSFPEVYRLKYKSEVDWSYDETIGVQDTVYIVGSGHVGLALTRVMATLNFHVVVIDHRPDVDTFLNNSFGHEKLVSPYEEIGRIIEGNQSEYVALVTTAYKCDEAALREVIRKNVKYIGMMGSEAKTKQIFDDLKTEGVTDEELQRVHTPIGLSIHSHTPEEIAVSIAAEIIKVRNDPAN